MIGLGLSLLLSAEQMQGWGWGWRSPFLVGLCIIPVGFYIRRAMPETAGAGHGDAEATTGAVLSRLLHDHGGKFALMIPILLCGTVSTYPAVPLMTTSPGAATLLSMSAVLNTPSAMSAAASLVAIPELLPRSVRGAGLSIAYAFVVTVFGGTTRLVVTWLIGVTGDPLAPAYYVILTSSIIGLVAVVAIRETGGETPELVRLRDARHAHPCCLTFQKQGGTALIGVRDVSLQRARPLGSHRVRAIVLQFIQHSLWRNISRNLADFFVLICRNAKMFHHDGDHGGYLGHFVFGKQVDL